MAKCWTVRAHRVRSLRRMQGNGLPNEQTLRPLAQLGRSRVASWLAGLAFTLALATPLRAAEYYVSPAGDDRNPGTPESPLRTVQRAVELAGPGDVVFIKAGTYPGVRIQPARGLGRSGKPGQPIVYRAYMDGDALITGGVWIEAEYIEFHGLKITNPKGHGVFLCGARTPAGSGTTVTHHIRFIGCEIFDCYLIGVLADYDVHHNEFLYCNVHHNGKRTPPKDGEGQGFYVGGDYNLFLGNEIHDNADNGLQIWASKGWGDDVANPTGNLIVGNKVYRNGFGVKMAGIAVGACCGGDSNLVANNLIWGNCTYGLHICGSLGKDNRFVNNTIYGNETGIALYSSAGPGTVILNNLVSGNRTNFLVWDIADRPNHLSTLWCDYNLWDPMGTFTWRGASVNSLSRYSAMSGMDTHSLAADPLFVDATSADFRLRAGSPAIDAGLELPDIRLDIAGVPRPEGRAFDIGAYEYHEDFRLHLNASSTSGEVPFRVELEALASGGTEPYTFAWDFGDGSSSTSGPWTEHTYVRPGFYTVRVRARDKLGASAEATLILEARGASPPVPTETGGIAEILVKNRRTSAPVTEVATNTWYLFQVTLSDPGAWVQTEEVQLALQGPSFSGSGWVFDPTGSYGVRLATDGRALALQSPGDTAWTEVTGRTGLYVDASPGSYRLEPASGRFEISLRLLPQAIPGRWHVTAVTRDRSGRFSSPTRVPFSVIQPPELFAEILSEGPLSDSTAGSFFRVVVRTSRPVVKIPGPLYFHGANGRPTPVPLEGTVPGSVFEGRIWKTEQPGEGRGYFELGTGALEDSLGYQSEAILSGQSLLVDWPPDKPQGVMTVSP